MLSLPPNAQPNAASQARCLSPDSQEPASVWENMRLALGGAQDFLDWRGGRVPGVPQHAESSREVGMRVRYPLFL